MRGWCPSPLSHASSSLALYGVVYPYPTAGLTWESSPQTAKPPDLDSSALTTQLFAFLIHSGYQFIHDLKFVLTTLTSKWDTRVARGIMYLPLPYLLRLVVTHTNKKTKKSYHLIYSSLMVNSCTPNSPLFVLFIQTIPYNLPPASSSVVVADNDDELKKLLLYIFEIKKKAFLFRIT